MGIAAAPTPTFADQQFIPWLHQVPNQRLGPGIEYQGARRNLDHQVLAGPTRTVTLTTIGAILPLERLPFEAK